MVQLAWLGRAAAIDDSHAELHNLIGEVHRRGGRIEQAERRFERALELDPELEIAYSNLALIRELQCRLDDQIALLERARELDSRRAEIHFNLCPAYARAERFAEAEAACRRYLALRPSAEDTDLVKWQLGMLLEEPKAMANMYRAIAAEQCRTSNVNE